MSHNASILAVEPVAAIDAISQRYRRLVFLAAAFTLALAAAFAARLARPLAQAVGDVARLTRQVQTDSLTNLANRRGLTERLDSELARARENGTSVSFVIADIDNFKAVNDGYGHQTGDHIIRAVAQALASSVRELDLAARYGGEEFAVVLPGSRLADARRTAERMRRAVSEIEVPGPNGRDRARDDELWRRRVSDLRRSRGARGRGRRGALPGEARRQGSGRDGDGQPQGNSPWPTTPRRPSRSADVTQRSSIRFVRVRCTRHHACDAEPLTACTRMRRAVECSSAAAITAATAPSMSSTRKPVLPSAISSGIEPRSNAITGVPHAIASTTLYPNGSSNRIRCSSAVRASEQLRSLVRADRADVRHPVAVDPRRNALVEVLLVLHDARR